MSGIIVAG